MERARRRDGVGLARGFGPVSREERLQADLFLSDLLARPRVPRPSLPALAEHQVTGAAVLRAGAVGPAVDGTTNVAHIGLVSPSGAFSGANQLAQINALRPT